MKDIYSELTNKELVTLCRKRLKKIYDLETKLNVAIKIIVADEHSLKIRNIIKEEKNNKLKK